MMMVSVHLRVSDENREAVLGAMRQYIGPTSVKPGCLSSLCYQHIDERNRLLLEEQWDSRELLTEHVRSADYLSFLVMLESSMEEPQLEFHEVERTKGIDMVYALRGAECDRPSNAL